MFGADVQIGSGLMGRGSLLNINLTTRQHEVLYGFNKDGRVLYFGRGDDLGQLSIMAENTNFDPEDSSRIYKLDATFSKLGEARDVFIFSDSVLIFSSDMAGGLEAMICIIQSIKMANGVNQSIWETG